MTMTPRAPNRAYGDRVPPGMFQEPRMSMPPVCETIDEARGVAERASVGRKVLGVEAKSALAKYLTDAGRDLSCKKVIENMGKRGFKVARADVDYFRAYVGV